MVSRTSQRRRVVLVTKSSFVYRYAAAAAFLRADASLNLVGAVLVSKGYTRSVQRAERSALRSYPLQLGLNGVILGGDSIEIYLA